MVGQMHKKQWWNTVYLIFQHTPISMPQWLEWSVKIFEDLPSVFKGKNRRTQKEKANVMPYKCKGFLLDQKDAA